MQHIVQNRQLKKGTVLGTSQQVATSTADQSSNGFTLHSRLLPKISVAY